MTAIVSVERLTKKYRDQTALDDVTFTIGEHCITGLLGRNGAGKTTLMRILTGQEFRTEGNISIFGEDPTENDAVLRRMLFVRDNQRYPDIKFKRVLEAARWFHPNWDQELADDLVAEFDLPHNRAVKKFSRGMLSAAGIVIGLAARAELTFFDEPYLGLDATARQIFYDRMLADYAEHPRTIVLSTHLIDEIADLLENVLVIDHGRIVLDAAADELRGRAVTVSGADRLVRQFVAGHDIWHAQLLAGRSRVTIAGPVDELERRRAVDAGLDLEPVSLQELVVRSGASGSRAGERISA